MKLFLTSSPTGAYRSDEPPAFRGFDPANGMVEELKRYWKPDSRCLLIAAFPDAFEENEVMRSYFEGVIEDTGLSAVCLNLCDGRNGKEAVQDLHSYDMIILSGGHVPTENDFFMEIGLPEQIRDFDGIVMGISAGTMNCAEIVYAQPEEPEEAGEPGPVSHDHFFDDLRKNLLDSLLVAGDERAHDAFGEFFLNHDLLGGFGESEES